MLLLLMTSGQSAPLSSTFFSLGCVSASASCPLRRSVGGGLLLSQGEVSAEEPPKAPASRMMDRHLQTRKIEAPVSICLMEMECSFSPANRPFSHANQEGCVCWRGLAFSTFEHQACGNWR